MEDFRLRDRVPLGKSSIGDEGGRRFREAVCLVGALDLCEG